ncbi:hypothetical protein SEEA1592_14650 [Salmonella enterica subsp. enterica serovar Anatum str. ATCC BAA-1592]|nr:hypothetical protein SEEA1592_14650 [Salmonella enterica subsp. enterica serovar Anatum str. ATCC BAA-1592]ERG00905.1 hypothetical protein SEEMU129_17715 [Salmonella enterica subsp. enterica serovar Muenchen str. RKS4129]ERO05794.1 hypothetical protein SEEN0114_05195 [Salmonella enterica subsp. enterica serovar Newport str. \
MPDGKINQQSCGNMHIIHDTQRPGVYLGSAIVPHKVANAGRHHAEKHQNAPLQRGFRQLLRVPQQRPRHRRHQKRSQIEPRKGVVLRHGTGLHQTFIPHHSDSETDIRKLHQEQTDPKMVGHAIVANNPGANHRQQRAKCIAPAQTTLTHHIVNQRDIERRQNGKQQQFGYGQIEVSMEAQHIHDAKLHRPHQHIQADGF